VRVWAVPATEGENRPDQKINAMYGMTLDGVAVCHMGDIGTPMSLTQANALRGRADVLLALAGGNRTIAIDDLLQAIEGVEARMIIPMHYRTPSLLYDIGDVEGLLERWDGPVERMPRSSIEVTTASLPTRPTVVTLLPQSDRLARLEVKSCRRR
jgi:L-ascorbate metabolism protein UlaG (beta-lactamase superfamily)